MKYYVYIEFITEDYDAVGFLCDKVVCTDDSVVCSGIHLLNEYVEREYVYETKYIETLTITGKDLNAKVGC